MGKFWNFINVNINKLVNHYGSDKCLHFLVGAWLTSMATPLGFWFTMLMVAFVVVISYIKEAYVDNIGDKVDINAAICGSSVSLMIWFFIELIKML